MGIWDKIEGAAKSLGNAAATAATTPAKVVVAVAGGAPANEAVAAGAGELAVAAAGAAATLTLPDKAAVGVAEDLGGEGAGKLAQAAVSGHVFSVNLAAAVPAMVAAEGEAPTPTEIVASPVAVVLAGALAAAAEQLRPAAETIPTMVRLALSGHFSSSLLSRARFTIGRIGITLPEAINGFQDFMGNHAHAVTVDDVIVFSQEPGQSEQAVRFWAHELQHVVQYTELGVAGFAMRYVTDYQSLESEAEAKAASVAFH